MAEDRARELTRFTELRIHGVGNTPPDQILGERTVLVGGDAGTSFHRGVSPSSHREAYSWGGLTSTGRFRALWVLLLPFALANTAGWMRPTGDGKDDDEPRGLFHGLARLLALWSTVAAFLLLASIFVDVVFLQCARLEECREGQFLLRWIPESWADEHATRLVALGVAIPYLLIVSMGAVGWWSRSLTEERLEDGAKPAIGPHRPRLARVPLWAGGAMVQELGRVHVAAALAAVALSTEAAIQLALADLELTTSWRTAVIVVALVVLLAAAVRAVLIRDTAGDGVGAGRWATRGLVLVAATLAGLSVVDAFVIDPLADCSDVPPFATCAGAWTDLRAGFAQTSFAVGLVPVMAALAMLFYVSSAIARGARWTGAVLTALLAGSLVAEIGRIAASRSVPAIAVPLMGRVPVTFVVILGVFFGGVAWSLAAGLWKREDLRSLPFYGTGSVITVATGFAILVAVLSGFATWVAERLAGGAGLQVVIDDPLPATTRIHLWTDYQIVAFGLVGYLLGYLVWAAARWLNDRRGREERWQRWDGEYHGRTDHSPSEPRRSPSPMASDRRAWLKRIDTMRMVRRRWVRSATRPLWWGILFAIAYFFAVYFSQLGPAVFGDDVWFVVRWVVDVAFDLLPLVFVGLALLVWRSLRSRESRRGVGMVWDVLTFWPRWFHPLAPPSYASRAVPELRMRLRHRLASPPRQVVVSAHSQGSVLAFAALVLLPATKLSRVFLITYGSPLSSLYGRFFPVYFGGPELAQLAHLLSHDSHIRWRNLFRLTDPIGGPIASRTAGDDVNELFRVHVDRGLQDPFPIPPHRGEVPPPPLGHSHYTDAAQYRQLLTHLRLLGRRDEPLVPIDPDYGRTVPTD